MDSINQTHKVKMRHFNCIPHWQIAQTQISQSDFRTVYTPAGTLNENHALYKPEDIYSKLMAGGEHQLLTGRYLNRFRDPSRKLTIEAQMLSRGANPQAFGEIFVFFNTLVAMEEGESVRVENMKINLVQNNHVCGIKLFQFRPVNVKGNPPEN